MFTTREKKLLLRILQNTPLEGGNLMTLPTLLAELIAISQKIEQSQATDEPETPQVEVPISKRVQ